MCVCVCVCVCGGAKSNIISIITQLNFMFIYVQLVASHKLDLPPYTQYAALLSVQNGAVTKHVWLFVYCDRSPYKAVYARFQ